MGRKGVLALSLVLLLSPAAAQSASDGTLYVIHSPVGREGGSTETLARFGYFNSSQAAVGARVVWDFGDGSPPETSPVQDSWALANHSYNRSGTFHVMARTESAGGLVADEDAVEVTVSAPASFPALRSTAYWVMPLFTGMILLGLALLVLLRGQPVVYNRVFFILYSTSAVKSFTEAAMVILGPARLWETPRAGYQVAYDINTIAGFFLITLFLWFVVVFPRPIAPWLKNGARGAVLLLLALPFVLNHLFNLIPDATLRPLFNVYVSLAALAALGLLVYHAWETDSDEERNRIRLLSASFFLLVFATVVIAGFQVLIEGSNTTGEVLYYYAWDRFFSFIVAPALELLGSMILMYAILRYQLLGIEVFVKRVTRATLFAVTIGATFVIVSNTVEEIVQSTVLGNVPLAFLIAGFISAGMMFPVQKLTERVANRLFPKAGSTQADDVAQRRMEIYEAQLRYALLDGVLKQKELTMLNALRDTLGIRPEELRKVAALFPGVDPRVLLGAPPAAKARGA